MHYRLFSLILLCITPLTSQAEAVGGCREATTTVEMNQCMTARLDALDKTMQRYYMQAITRIKQSGEENHAQVARIDQAQTAWKHYRDSECDAVYQTWRDGTIRGAMALSCKITLTQARIHTLWQNWIAPVDDSPPDLPEPNFD